jgi:hypothetical protein
MKEGNDAITHNFQTVKGAIGGLVTKNDMQEISSAISNVMGNRMGSPLPSYPTKKKTPIPIMPAHPNNKAPPTEV